jgi:uncharacterized membrane protein YgcG
MDASAFNVYSAPRRELPIVNSKFIKNCTELYLGDRGITHVRGMEEFANLEVLWLHSNSIATLADELAENTRLKRLFLHDNDLKSLTTMHLECLFLEKLTLFNNNITDLNACLATLKRLRHLEELDLTGNPCAEEPSYRIRVLAAIPTLHVFDKHVVTESERVRAARLRRAQIAADKGIDVHKKNETKRASSKEDDEDAISIASSGGEGRMGGNNSNMSGTERLLYQELSRVRREEAAQAKIDHELEFKRAMEVLEEQKELSGEALRKALLPKGINFTQIENDKRNGVGENAGALLAWDEYRLRKLFQKYDDDGSGELSLAEIKCVMGEMEDFGLRLKNTGPKLDPSEFDTLRELRVAQAERSAQELQQLFEELDESGDGQVDIAEFMKGLNGGIDWEMLPPDVAEERANKAGRQSLHTQEKAMLLPDGHADKSTLMLDALELSRKSQRLEKVAQLGRDAEENGDKHSTQSFQAASKSSSASKEDEGGGGGGGGGGGHGGHGSGGSGGSRFGAKPMGKIVEIGQAPTSGRGDYISYYTARFGKGKKKKVVDEGKRNAEDADEAANSDSEDEEEFEERVRRENKYQKQHAHTHNVRQMQRKGGDSKTKGKLAHSTSRVALPGSLGGARKLKARFGLTSGNADFELYKKDQESKAAYEVCKYTESM